MPITSRFIAMCRALRGKASCQIVLPAPVAEQLQSWVDFRQRGRELGQVEGRIAVVSVDPA